MAEQATALPSPEFVAAVESLLRAREALDGAETSHGEAARRGAYKLINDYLAPALKAAGVTSVRFDGKGEGDPTVTLAPNSKARDVLVNTTLAGLGVVAEIAVVVGTELLLKYGKRAIPLAAAAAKGAYRLAGRWALKLGAAATTALVIADRKLLTRVKAWLWPVVGIGAGVVAAKKAPQVLSSAKGLAFAVLGIMALMALSKRS